MIISTVTVIVICSIIKRVYTIEDTKFVPISREFLDKIRNESLYNRYSTPTQYDGIPTNVSMSMYIESISSFSAQTMDYHLDMYFQQEWMDPRLSHDGPFPMLLRDRSVFKDIWHPDVYFANAREASYQDITEDNFLVWIHPEGRIFYDCRISMQVICMMDLAKYPLDKQKCDLRILSYAYPESQLRLRWTDAFTPIDRNMDIRMPDMHLIDIRTGTCNGTYTTGVWSCMTAVFDVEREMMHHIIQTYLPTALIVVISWFNFWLDIDSAPARVSLSITTLLTISTQSNAVKLALPEVSYMKAIDVWLGSCMVFVFGVMIEFTVCHFARNLQELIPTNTTQNIMVDTALSTLFGERSMADDLRRMGGTIDRRLQSDEESANNTFNRSHHQMHRCHSSVSSPHIDARLRIPEIIEPPSPIHYPSLHHRHSHQIESTTGNNNHEHTVFYIGAGRLTNKVKKTNSFSRLRNRVNRRALHLSQSLRKIRGRKAASAIDERCRYIFPLTFMVFNMCYWIYYLVISDK